MIFGDLCATKKAKEPSEPLAVEALQAGGVNRGSIKHFNLGEK